MLCMIGVRLMICCLSHQSVTSCMFFFWKVPSSSHNFLLVWRLFKFLNAWNFLVLKYKTIWDRTFKSETWFLVLVDVYLFCILSVNLELQSRNFDFEFGQQVFNSERHRHLLPAHFSTAHNLRRSNRFPTPLCKINRFQNSIIPYVIHVLNDYIFIYLLVWCTCFLVVNILLFKYFSIACIFVNNLFFMYLCLCL